MSRLRGFCRKVVAVGRNYSEHVKELGNKMEKEPVIFLKPSSSIIEEGTAIEISGLIQGYVVALDMTDRNLQNSLKSRQLPWSLAKCFDTSCPIGPMIPLSALPESFLQSNFRANPTPQLWLTVNGVERQRGDLLQMIWSPAELISFISARITLEPGDLILTGTPAGCGPVKPGDIIKAGLGDVSQISFSVTTTDN